MFSGPVVLIVEREEILRVQNFDKKEFPQGRPIDDGRTTHAQERRPTRNDDAYRDFVARRVSSSSSLKRRAKKEVKEESSFATRAEKTNKRSKTTERS